METSKRIYGVGLSARITAKLKPDELDALDQVAAAKGVSRNSLIRMGVYLIIGEHGIALPGRETRKDVEAQL